MPRQKRSIFRILFATAIFILMEVAALHFLSGSGSMQRIWIARVSHGVQRNVWGWTESVRYYFSLDGQNRTLAEENLRLRDALNRYTDLDSEAGLDAVLSQLPPSGFDYVCAKVVKMSGNKQHNYLIIDKGSEDGVAPQDGIVTSRGVIGIVEAVGDHYAYAIALRNKDMSISARLGLSGASGPMSWDGRSANGAILREIPLQYRFEAGDTVYTSGHSSIFPPDIPLGTTGEAKIVNGATWEIEVDMFQDFSTLKYVAVVRNTGEAEIRALEERVAAEGGAKR